MAQPLNEKQLDKLRSVDSPTIHNITLLFDIRSVTAGFTNHTIKAAYPELPPTVGYAVTTTWRTAYDPRVKTAEGNAFRAIEASEKVPKPFIIVKQDLDTVPAGALYGEMYVMAVTPFGCAGIVTNGAGRDYEQVRRLEFPCFTSCMLAGRGYSKCLELGVPVEVGGMTIRPGDLLHADANGVVLIPDRIAEAVVELIDPFLAAEQMYMDYSSGDDVTPQGISSAFAESKALIDELEKKAKSML